MLLRGTLTVVLGVSAAVAARGQERLGWRFKPGDHFKVESTVAVKEVSTYRENTAAGKAGNATLRWPVAGSFTAVSSFTVLRREQDGVVLEQKIESVKVTEGKGAYQHYRAVEEGLPGAVLALHLNGRGEITRLKGYRELFRRACRKLGAAPVELEALLTEDLVRQLMEPALLQPPDRAVAPGQTWKRPLRVLPVGEPLGFRGLLQLDLEYRYEGEGKGGYQVTVRGTPRHLPPRPGATIWPYRFAKGEIRKDEARGKLLFDAKAGRLVRLDLRVPFRGTLAWDTGGLAYTEDVEQEVSLRFRVLDVRPGE